MASTFGTTSCTNALCPPCFLMNTNFGAIYLTISSCLSAEFSSALSSLSLTVFQTFTFINTGYGAAVVSDGTNTYMVTRSGHRGSTIVCSCITSNLLTCDASVTPVIFYSTDATLNSNPSSECISISADSTYDISSRVCGSGFSYCPSCWILDTSSGTVSLTLSNCDNYYKIDVSSQSGMMAYTFLNTGSNLATISDGTNSWSLAAPGSGTSQAKCTCYVSGGNHLFACDIPAVAASGSTPINTFPQNVEVLSQVRFGGSTTYINYDSGIPALQMYIGSNRALSGTSTAGGSGILHGTWALDAATVTSDIRFKRDIEPLRSTLRRLWKEQSHADKQSMDESVDERQLFAWMLNQLRPVSYISKTDPLEARRFGFIAQELEQALPNMVRIVEHPDESRKTVHLLDLIALLVAASQQQNSQLESLEREDKAKSIQLHDLLQRVSLVEHLRQRLDSLERSVEQLRRETNRCCGNVTFQHA
ncbi:unnamed protein product [Durusdinium trenchii]|uniref:Peptidase S74 domain-containing protein n=1 Tax=Durusdinium trenchii TaxID=1381693 RepID=A0ABP0JAP7_9DINO